MHFNHPEIGNFIKLHCFFFVVDGAKIWCFVISLLQKCKRAYENKNFSMHSVTEYCSWCAKETELFPCNKCNVKFCKVSTRISRNRWGGATVFTELHITGAEFSFFQSCITKNFRLSRLIFKQIEERKWECCVCAPKQIWPHRALCSAVKSFIEKTNNTVSNVPSFFTNLHTYYCIQILVVERKNRQE